MKSPRQQQEYRDVSRQKKAEIESLVALIENMNKQNDLEKIHTSGGNEDLERELEKLRIIIHGLERQNIELNQLSGDIFARNSRLQEEVDETEKELYECRAQIEQINLQLSMFGAVDSDIYMRNYEIELMSLDNFTEENERLKRQVEQVTESTNQNRTNIMNEKDKLHQLLNQYQQLSANHKIIKELQLSLKKKETKQVLNIQNLEEQEQTLTKQIKQLHSKLLQLKKSNIAKNRQQKKQQEQQQMQLSLDNILAPSSHNAFKDQLNSNTPCKQFHIYTHNKESKLNSTPYSSKYSQMTSPIAIIDKYHLQNNQENKPSSQLASIYLQSPQIPINSKPKTIKPTQKSGVAFKKNIEADANLENHFEKFIDNIQNQQFSSNQKQQNAKNLSNMVCNNLIEFGKDSLYTSYKQDSWNSRSKFNSSIISGSNVLMYNYCIKKSKEKTQAPNINKKQVIQSQIQSQSKVKSVSLTENITAGVGIVAVTGLLYFTFAKQQ